MNIEKHSEQRGYDLMNAAFEVHNTIGGGLAEEIYQESLEIELTMRGIGYKSKPGLTLEYKGRKLQKQYFPDLLLGEEIVVELKAVSKLLPEHEGQLLNYMRISKVPVGYLINFGPIEKLEWQRFII
jgi:GxxExxY protein